MTATAEGDTISVTELAALSIDNRFTQFAAASQNAAEAIDNLAVSAKRRADALERIAVASEALLGLFAAVSRIDSSARASA